MYAFTLPLAQMSKKKKKGNVSKKWTCRLPNDLLKILVFDPNCSIFFMCGIFFMPPVISVACVCVCVCARACVCVHVCVCSVPIRICLGAHCIFFLCYGIVYIAHDWTRDSNFFPQQFVGPSFEKERKSRLIWLSKWLTWLTCYPMPECKRSKYHCAAIHSNFYYSLASLRR